MSNYVFANGRFRDKRTGRFVSRARVEQVLENRIEDGIERMGHFLDAVLDSGLKTTIADWQLAMADELRNMHGQLAMLGRGGAAMMTPSDWGRVGAKLRQEYKFLNNFAAQISDGTLSQAQIRARMAQYAGGVWSSYWQAWEHTTKELGITHESRIAIDDDGTCTDCEDYADAGIVPIGTLPSPGEKSVCGHRCRCKKVFHIRRQDKFIEVDY